MRVAYFVVGLVPRSLITLRSPLRADGTKHGAPVDADSVLVLVFDVFHCSPCLMWPPGGCIVIASPPEGEFTNLKRSTTSLLVQANSPRKVACKRRAHRPVKQKFRVFCLGRRVHTFFPSTSHALGLLMIAFLDLQFMIRDSRMRAMVHHEPITPVSGYLELNFASSTLAVKRGRDAARNASAVQEG